MQRLEQLYLARRIAEGGLEEPILELGAGWDLEFHRAPFRAAGFSSFYAHELGEPSVARVEFLGDLCERTNVPDDFAGTCLLFNVLEHVRTPWLAVDEAWRIIRPGGALAGSVPLRTAIHRHPRDYWRICPDGLAFLLRRFRIAHFAIDGNAGLPANLLFVSFKDSSRPNWEDHNQAAVLSPEVIVDNDHVTNNRMKRLAVRLLRRYLGMSLEIWDGPWNKERMLALDYRDWRVTNY